MDQLRGLYCTICDANDHKYIDIEQNVLYI